MLWLESYLRVGFKPGQGAPQVITAAADPLAAASGGGLGGTCCSPRPLCRRRYHRSACLAPVSYTPVALKPPPFAGLAALPGRNCARQAQNFIRTGLICRWGTVQHACTSLLLPSPAMPCLLPLLLGLPLVLQL